jgi:hypothetical protein
MTPDPFVSSAVGMNREGHEDLAGRRIVGGSEEILMG